MLAKLGDIELERKGSDHWSEGRVHPISDWASKKICPYLILKKLYETLLITIIVFIITDYSRKLILTPPKDYLKLANYNFPKSENPMSPKHDPFPYPLNTARWAAQRTPRLTHSTLSCF
jgi:hypothetical protein